MKISKPGAGFRAGAQAASPPVMAAGEGGTLSVWCQDALWARQDTAQHHLTSPVLSALCWLLQLLALIV